MNSEYLSSACQSFNLPRYYKKEEVIFHIFTIQIQYTSYLQYLNSHVWFLTGIKKVLW